MFFYLGFFFLIIKNKYHTMYMVYLHPISKACVGGRELFW